MFGSDRNKGKAMRFDKCNACGGASPALLLHTGRNAVAREGWAAIPS